jgi:hypothetical protein
LDTSNLAWFNHDVAAGAAALCDLAYIAADWPNHIQPGFPNALGANASEQIGRSSNCV